MRLARGEIGAGYSEAVLILTSILNALSAHAWPGEDRIDRKRFNEALATLVPLDFGTTRISVPLLIRKLRETNRPKEAKELASALSYETSTLVVTGADVDRTEVEVRNAHPSLELNFIRKCSYSDLLYRELRSSYAHLYQPGERTDEHHMTDRTADVSYVNWLNKPDRNIHFHVEWVSKLAQGLAHSIDSASPEPPYAVPGKWWIEGY